MSKTRGHKSTYEVVNPLTARNRMRDQEGLNEDSWKRDTERRDSRI